MKHIQQKLFLPGEAPVMVLPGASLFPATMLPLYIFEERYRAMLSGCLEDSRVFCVAQMTPGFEGLVNNEPCYSVAGLGLIRACVGNEDGTSHLILQGLARVKLTEFVRRKPYPVARIKELRSTVGNNIEADALGLKVLELCRSLKPANSEFDRLLNHTQSASAEMISDFVAQAFVADPGMRQRCLEELRVCERLRMLIGCLKNDQ
jgi:Lon protease-like protein